MFREQAAAMQAAFTRLADLPARARRDAAARGRDLVEGIGGRTDARILRAITEGVSADGRRMFPPMGCGCDARMAPGDLAGVLAWPRSIPALP